MLSTRHAKHAKPALHPTRTTLSTGLTAVLLPLCMAAPALAEGETSPTTAPAATSTATVVPAQQATSLRISGPSGGVPAGSYAVGARLLDEQGAAIANEAVDLQRWNGSDWAVLDHLTTDSTGLVKKAYAFPTSTKVRAVYAGSAFRASSVTPELAVRIVQATSMRISGPAGAVNAGSHSIGVRLLAGGTYVPNAYVRVERQTASGWVYLGRMITDANGLARQSFGFTASTSVRAVYEGSATRASSVSPVVRVTIGSFRLRAVQVAAAQNGKPYSYGSVGPNSFDCSGLVKYSFAKVGKTLPRTSGDMFRATTRIAPSAKQPGDLIFMSNDGRIGHVGVYAGDGLMWDAPTSGGYVSKRRIYSASYYVGRVS